MLNVFIFVCKLFYITIPENLFNYIINKKYSRDKLALFCLKEPNIFKLLNFINKGNKNDFNTQLEIIFVYELLFYFFDDNNSWHIEFNKNNKLCIFKNKTANCELDYWFHDYMNKITIRINDYRKNLYSIKDIKNLIDF